MTNLAGRGALVTGAGRGIGQACAIALGEAGARLFVVDRDLASLEETLATLHQAGVEASGFGADMADEAQVEAMVAEACTRLGKLDIAINCEAAILIHQSNLIGTCVGKSSIGRIGERHAPPAIHSTAVRIEQFTRPAACDAHAI